jgi:ribosomal protein S18 acetylase RimI-like enzyme
MSARRPADHSPRFRVRRLRRGDEARVLGAAPLFDDPPVPSAVRAYLADRANVFFLAADGTRAVGFLRGTGLRQLHGRKRQMFLYEVAVARSHRRHGVGSALVAALLRYCRRRGFEEVFVFTNPRNTAAVRLYRGTGGRTETSADRMFVYRL